MIGTRTVIEYVGHYDRQHHYLLRCGCGAEAVYAHHAIVRYAACKACCQRKFARPAVLRAFTGVNDPEDDDVDALAHLWNGLSGAAAGASTMTGAMSPADVLVMLGHARDDAAA